MLTVIDHFPRPSWLTTHFTAGGSGAGVLGVLGGVDGAEEDAELEREKSSKPPTTPTPINAGTTQAGV